MTLVDTNVLLDILTNDQPWKAWSIRQLDLATLRGPIIINDLVYAELSVGFRSIETLDAALKEARVTFRTIPRAALFLAGKAFRSYRANGGARTSLLPDFFIGAHAAVAGWPLLTRDTRRYRSYFPTVELLTP